MNVQQYSDDEYIETTQGKRRVGDMVKKLSSWDNDNEVGCAREFYHNGEMVRRDVSIQLKKMPSAEGQTGGWVHQLKGALKRQLALRKRVVRGTRGFTK